MKTDTNVVLRPLQEDDIQLLPTIFNFPWLSKEKWKHYFQEQTDKIRAVCIVEKEKSPVGYGSLLRQPAYPYFKEKGIPEICDIWILEEVQRNGLGTQLIHHLEKMAKKEGYSTIGIGVGLYRDYGPAQRLYIKLGYRPDGMGVTYKGLQAIAGEQYPLDDDFLLWLTKAL